MGSHLNTGWLSRTKFVPNRSNSREKMNLELANIKGLDGALCLYEGMSALRLLPNLIQFNQLLSSVLKLKEYSVAVRIFKGICNLGIPVNEYTMTIAINYCCLSGRLRVFHSGLVLQAWLCS